MRGKWVASGGGKRVVEAGGDGGDSWWPVGAKLASRWRTLPVDWCACVSRDLLPAPGTGLPRYLLQGVG